VRHCEDYANALIFMEVGFSWLSVFALLLFDHHFVLRFSFPSQFRI
jgi:hypothetical protein